jgi:hypothetical protein
MFLEKSPIKIIRRMRLDSLHAHNTRHPIIAENFRFVPSKLWILQTLQLGLAMNLALVDAKVGCLITRLGYLR